ncbi:MAG: carcinine hydrolase/isopenicillin-N N-acyltransferase family protein [Thermoproteota archaeon]
MGCASPSQGVTSSTGILREGGSTSSWWLELLDNCRTVDEAVEQLQKIPVGGYWSFLMTDKNNKAALAQFFDGGYAIKRIGPDSAEQWGRNR